MSENSQEQAFMFQGKSSGVGGRGMTHSYLVHPSHVHSDYRSLQLSIKFFLKKTFFSFLTKRISPLCIHLKIKLLNPNERWSLLPELHQDNV